MCVCGDDLVCEVEVVVECVEIFCWVEEVVGVVEGDFGDGCVGVLYGFDCWVYLFDVVECVEDLEDVDVVGCCFCDEGFGDCGGVGCVVDCVVFV